METTKAVTLAGRSVTLALPSSVVARQQAVFVSAKSPMLALGAAIGVCWPQLPRLKTKIAAHGFDYAAFGHAVLDELYGAGATLQEITIAGNWALEVCVEHSMFIGQDEVDEQTDFLGGSGETNTTGSKSPDSGENHPVGLRRKTTKRK
jgi:hypothetical protein